jgi:ParB-like chromosome segregation protein Spo0J
VEHVPIEEIAADATFRLREPGDVAELAVSMGRLGQLAPVDLRPLPPGSPDGEGKRWQVVAGFRRMEALRLLQRERVLARVHPALGDPDAWALALAGPLFEEPWTAAELDAIAGKVRASLPWAEPVLAARRKRAATAAAPSRGAAREPAAEAPRKAAPEPARTPSADPAPDPASFARQLAVRAYDLNRELAAAFETWPALPPEGRALVLTQLRYLARLLPMLERETT